MDHDYKMNKIMGNDISSNSDVSNNTITLQYPPSLPLFYTLSNMNAPFYNSISEYISGYISDNISDNIFNNISINGIGQFLSPNTTVAPIISPPIIPTNITVIPTLSPSIIPPWSTITSSNINSDLSTNEL